MAYCTNEDVNTRIQYVTLTETSNPTLVEVTEFITDIEADMNARMRAVGITPIPVTDASGIATLKPISIDGTIARIYRSIDKMQDRADAFQDRYDKAMDRITDNPAIIMGSITGEVSDEVGYSEQARAYAENLPFQVGKRQW